MSATPRTEFSHLQITTLKLHIGAKVSGIDLSKPLRTHAVLELHAALVARKVVFFQEQALDDAGHVAFARQLGTPTIGHAVLDHDQAYPEIYSVAKHRTANSVRTKKQLQPLDRLAYRYDSGNKSAHSFNIARR